MADWYGQTREQLMSLHGLDTASMLGYGMGAAAAAFPPIQPEAYTHAHAAAAAAYNFQRQQQSVTTGFSHSCFGPEQQWRHGADGSIMELRKEKSRDAARSRRGKENYEYYELAKMLPLPGAITSQLDKASIIRLTISFLKLRDFTLHGDPPWHRDITSSKSLKGSNLRHRGSPSVLSVELFEQHQGTHILQSLDGFAFGLANDGRFLYIAETVSIYLGLSQVEMTGSSIFDYIHVDDHQELADQLSLTLATGQALPSPSSVNSEDAAQAHQPTMNPDVSYPVSSCMTMGASAKFKGYERAFCIRMKSTLTKRGCHFKCSGYRVVLVLGHMRPQYVFSHTRKNTPIVMGFVALAIALPPPSVHEVRLEPDMFVMKLNFDFRIAHCEPRISDLMDYNSEDVQGRSLYSLCHGQDVEKIRKAHTDLMTKGQVLTPYFRLLNKRGGFTWMQMCATIICNSKNGDDQNIISVIYVLSKCQYDTAILDDCQLDPTLLNLKPDQGDFLPSHSPEHTGDLPMVRVAECVSPAVGITGVSCSPPGVVASADGALRRSPENATAEGAQIKTEIPPGLMTPLGNSEISAVEDPSRSTIEIGRGTSPRGGRISIPPASTPSTPHSRTPGLTSATPITPTKVSEEGSVRDLEAAMTRHLPEDAADFSTDALLRSSTSGHRSTIQWVGGAPQTQSTNNSSAAQQGSLPASTLLRQLYANRESVIRTSVQRSYYPDVQATLPTPPGGETYQDGLFTKAQDQLTYNGATSTANSTTASSAYPDYHSAMTPPSSVSPREKLAAECAEMRQSAAAYLSEAGSANAPAQPLPLKPQVYYGPSTVGLEATSYSHLSPEQSSSLYPHSGFHLYHSNGKSSNAYDALRTSAGWYSPSS